MILYPTMQLSGRKCVTLTRGNLDQPVLWHVDPVETARRWAAQGASWMHLTDLDAIEGKMGNAELVQEIIRTAGIPVQLGGGFRSPETVAHWIDRGAGRIVLGTLATQRPEQVRALARRFPDQIVLAVDVWRGQVMRNGWRDASSFSPEEFIAEFNESPLAAILITDIDSDVEETDAQLGRIAGLAATCLPPVIASGVVRGIDDVARLKYIHHVDGAMLGRALFEKTVDLTEALRVAQPEREKVPAFI